jgi:hypothetical protein
MRRQMVFSLKMVLLQLMIPHEITGGAFQFWNKLYATELCNEIIQ